MPSRLKSLELHGYKTFAARTDFLFAAKITAIVGPNGSGKSNIADALRWVLGEQSYSLLRGKRTEDMIFSGSEQRPRASMASATVVFDNADGWLPIDFSEVAITRRAYRDGENEYLLNGQRVRLRDISELLAQSGLAERTYTIIGQGLVDAALALKAEERRRLFEEAAGIGLYRVRKEEALRRLETTQRNLERVEDILAELQPRLHSLERQARRAQEYEQLLADLRLVLREWYGYHWHRAQRELSEARETARQQELALAQVRQSQTGLDQKLAGLRQRLQQQRAQLGDWHRQLAQVHTHRETLARELAVADERERSLRAQRQAAFDELQRLAEQRELDTQREAAASQETAALRLDLEEARQQTAAARAALQARQAERLAAEKSLEETRQALAQLTHQLATLQARLAERQAQTARQQQALQSALKGAAQAEEELGAAEARLHRALASWRSAEAACQAAEDALAAGRQKLTEVETLRRQIQEAQAARQAEIARLRAQLEVLAQAEQALAGYTAGARALLKAAREGRLGGVNGALAGQLEVPAEYETAIAAALGEYADAVLIASGEARDEALTILEGEAARGVLLPLLALLPETPLLPPAELAGVVKLAARLVSAPEELRPAVDLLLGAVWVVPERATAQRVLSALGGRAKALRVVTLQGEVFHAAGPVISGSAAKGGPLGRSRQRRELSESLTSNEAKLAALQEQGGRLQAGLEALRAEVGRLEEDVAAARRAEREGHTAYSQAEAAFDKNRRQAEWQRGRCQSLREEIAEGESQASAILAQLRPLEERIHQARETLRAQTAALGELSLDEAQLNLSHWTTRLAVVERAVADGHSRLRDIQASLQRIQRTGAALQARLGEIEAALLALDGERATLRQSQAAATAESEALQALIAPAEAEVEKLESEQAALLADDAVARQALSLAEHHHAQARINLARKQEALDSLRQKIEDDLGLVAFEYQPDISGPTPLPLDGMVQQLPQVAELSSDVEENIKRQRAQLRRMGAINPEAQAEFEQVKERLDFLTTQVADLKQAEADIREVIAELDLLMEREFRKTFDAVAHEFRQIFARLFGGGSARLVLTEPDNLTSTGIDIEARLPGRREQGLSLLSGGERSLTAVALVFALLKFSPTPFCVMDEVDAMLDEANVGRFRELLSELSEKTQFIVITHNRNTVQAAEIIYGVTMGRDSSSQVVSLKLDEISQVVNNQT